MALTDPVAIDFGAGSVNLPKISVNGSESVYSTADGTKKFKASHAYGKRIRRVLRVDVNKYSTDPVLTTTNVYKSMSCYIVFDVPAQGFTIAEQEDIYEGFIAYINASTHAVVTKILGGES